MPMIFSRSAAADPGALREFIADTPRRPEFTRVLMVDPEYFQVRYEINPHMKGQAGSVDPAAARREWRAVKSAYQSLGYDVLVMEGSPDFPDLVFAANQSMPFCAGEQHTPRAILSRMAKPERRGEVALMDAFLRRRGFQTHALSAGEFEGTGDIVCHPRRALAWAGHGFRSRRETLENVAAIARIRLIPLKLVDERCYHLDVCLMPVNEETAFACRAAFDEESWARLTAGFANLIEADENETMHGFALNGHCPDGKHLLLPAGNPKTRAAAQRLGLTVHELSTREFQKSGGSIFCLKNMLPAANPLEAI
jgi:N-dimethylarginine dimethylaminohydrolase